MKPLFSRLSWFLIFLAALFIVVTSFDDRCSRHADAWAKQTGDLQSEKLSEEE